jgi:microcystin-dependent protein
LFSLIGTTYGGDGQTTFALPDLQGRTAVGTGQGAGLSPQNLGEKTGVEQVTLTTAQLPQHEHSLPGTTDLTGLTGGGQPHTNIQPSLGLTYEIAINGIFPFQGGGSCLGAACLGEIRAFAFNPNFLGNLQGWLPADGRLLSIVQNLALFSILGTTYGGDGQTTFALPDLQGRNAIGIGQGIGLSNYALGEKIGVESDFLTVAQLPSHSHSLVATSVPEPSSILGTLFFGTVAGRLLLKRRQRLVGTVLSTGD